MKQLFLLLLLICSLAFSQDKNISVISLEKVNIVYRGIMNPIKIAVPGAKQYKVEAPGTLEKVDSLGNYNWNVTAVSGLKANVKITATMPDTSIIYEEKEFEIRSINPTTGTLDGNSYNRKTFELSKDQIANSVIGVKIDDFAHNKYKLNINAFSVYFPDNESIIVYGNKFDTIATSKLEEVKNGEHIIIHPITEYHNKIESIDITMLDEDIIPKPIVSLKNQNFVYKGIENELEIAVPGAKSFKVTATGLRDIGLGRYHWNVSQISGNTVKLDFEIITERDSVFHDSKKYYIKPVPKLIPVLNGQGCEKCIVEISRQDIKDTTISVRPETYFDCRLQNFFVDEYTLVLPEGYEYPIYEDKFSDSAQKMILQYPSGTIFKIKDIKYRFHGYGPPMKELKFILVDN